LALVVRALKKAIMLAETAVIARNASSSLARTGRSASI
jgi:hypothetical protein